MAFLTADSPLSVVLIVLFLLGGATIGITIMALVFAEGLRLTFSSGGDRDQDLIDQAAETES